MRRALIPVLLASLLVVPAPAAAAATCTPGYTSYGPASVTSAIVGATVHNGFAYVVTRGLKPPLLAEIDLATKRVTREVRLPDAPATGEAEGAWATTVSGGQIYVGTYPVPDLYRFDPATGEVAHLRSFGVNGGYIWSLATAPDGTVYAGTYPGGRVWEYNPATGAARDFGVLAAGERYVRSLAADSTSVYAGLLDKAKLVSINRSTGTVAVLAQGATGTGFGAVAEHGSDRVLGASGTTLFDVRKDGTDLKAIDLGGLSVDMITSSGGTAYLSTRPNGTIFSYRTGDPAPVELATPRLGEETRRLVPGSSLLPGSSMLLPGSSSLPGSSMLPGSSSLLGFSGSGGMWNLDLATLQTSYTDLIDAGLTTGPERPQSLLLFPNKAVYIGGHFSMTVRDLQTGATRRFWMPGEPKVLARRGHEIFAAIYPSGQIVALDTRDDSMRSLGYLGNGQKRPWDMEYDPVTDKLLVATAPLGADLRGALSIVDPDSGAVDMYHNVIANEALMSLSVDSEAGVVYLGGDVLGGGGTPAVRTAASVAAFDLRTRTVLWETDPVPGYRTFQDIKVHDGYLYGVYKRNASWFALDLSTRAIVASGPLPGYGEIEVHRGRVFTSTYFGGGNVHELSTTGATHLAAGLGDEWYTNPQLQFIPGTWDAWTLVGRDLVRYCLG